LTKKKPPQITSNDQKPGQVLPSFDRIYFDTEPLVAAGWPHLSVVLENVALLAKALNISLHVPELVYRELEARCFSDYDTEFDAATKRITALRNRLKSLGGQPLQVPQIPDLRTEMRKLYLATLEQRKQTFRPSPTPAMQTENLLEMAIAYELAFEQGDKGFKDTMIFLSVVEEVKSSPNATAIFVSNDGVFGRKKDELEARAKAQGAMIALCETLDKVQDALKQWQTTQKQNQIESNRQGLETALNRHFAEIQSWLDQKVESFNWQVWPLFSMGPLLVYRAEIQRLASVTPQYSAHRLSGERVKLTFDLEALLRASNITSAMRGSMDPQVILESSTITGAPHLRRYGSPIDLSVGSAVPIMQISQGLIEIEAEGTFDNGTYRNFKFLAARLKREMPRQMPPQMPPPVPPPW